MGMVVLSFVTVQYTTTLVNNMEEVCELIRMEVELSLITALYTKTLLSDRHMEVEEECPLVRMEGIVELSFVTALYTTILLIMMEVECMFI